MGCIKEIERQKSMNLSNLIVSEEDSLSESMSPSQNFKIVIDEVRRNKYHKQSYFDSSATSSSDSMDDSSTPSTQSLDDDDEDVDDIIKSFLKMQTRKRGKSCLV